MPARRSVPLLLLWLPAACTATPPDRSPQWWREEVARARPAVEPTEGTAEPSAAAALPAPAADTPWAVRWASDHYGAPGWAFTIASDGRATITSQEHYADGSVLRSAQRRLSVALSPTERERLRQLLQSDGLRHLPEHCGDGGEVRWQIELQIGDAARHCTWRGAFPPAGVEFVHAAWDLLVAPRAEQFAGAPLVDG